MAKKIGLLVPLVTLGTLVVPKVTSKSGNLSVLSYERNLQAKSLKNKRLTRLVNKSVSTYEGKLLVNRVVSVFAEFAAAPYSKTRESRGVTCLVKFSALAPRSPRRTAPQRPCARRSAFLACSTSTPRQRRARAALWLEHSLVNRQFAIKCNTIKSLESALYERCTAALSFGCGSVLRLL